MKSNKILLILIICIIYSCGGIVKTRDVVTLKYDSLNGLSSKENFVLLRDGTLIKGVVKEFKLKGNKYLKKGTVTINGTVYNLSQIRTFQDSTEHFTFLDKEGFLVKRKKIGKINLYVANLILTNTTSSGRTYTSYSELHWLQKGDKEPIQKFTIDLLETMVSDNTDAVRYIERYKENRKDSNRNFFIDKAIDIYNGDIDKEGNKLRIK